MQQDVVEISVSAQHPDANTGLNFNIKVPKTGEPTYQERIGC